jgi:cell division inhibitor SepF
MNYSTEPYPDHQEAGVWTWLKRRFGAGAPETYEDEAEEAMSMQRRRPNIRVDAVRGVQVTVRKNATVLNDARPVADGLKNGQQQVVNLERATQDQAARILDFLSGVTYALDGSVEKVGDRVYLFAPANVHVHTEEDSERP